MNAFYPIEPQRVVLSELSSINFGIQPESRHMSRLIHLELVSAILSAQPIFLLFDKDGLLINSEFVRKVAWINSFDRFGIETGLSTDTQSLRQFADEILELGWEAAIIKNLQHEKFSKLAYMGGLTEEKVNSFLLENFGQEIRSSRQYQNDEQAIYTLRQYRKDVLSSQQLDSLFQLRPAVMELLMTISDIKQILEEDFNCSIWCAVVTSDNRKDTEKDLLRFQIIKNFDAFVCAKEVDSPKPSADCYIEAAKRLKVYIKTERAPYCIGFEDAPIGVDSFHNAGMRGYFVKDLVDAPIDRSAAAKSESLESFLVMLKEAVRVAKAYRRMQ